MKRINIISILLISAFSLITQAQDTAVEVSIMSLPEGTIVTEGLEVELSIFTGAGEQLKECELFLNDVSQGKLSQAPFVFKLRNVPRSTVFRLKAVATSESGKLAVDNKLIKNNIRSDYNLSVSLTTVYASVTDKNGNYIRGLTQEDFIIEEDGRPQEISFFTSEATPLKAAVLMDVSSSMLGDRIARSQQAAIDLLEKIIGEQDRAMVLGFDHRLILYQTMTNDLDKLIEAIRMTGPNGGTALYDAVAGTTRRLLPMKGKRAIIVLSDGDDTDSRFQADEVLDYLQKSSVIVYSVGLQTLTMAQTRADETRQTINNLREMADFSGGKAYFPSFISHLPEIYSAIGKDLSSQYTIAYYPENKIRDGKWRRITVRVRNRPDLIIRNRKGYFAK